MKDAKKTVKILRFHLCSEGFEDAIVEEKDGKIEVEIIFDEAGLLGGFITTVHDLHYLKTESVSLVFEGNGVTTYKIILKH